MSFVKKGVGLQVDFKVEHKRALHIKYKYVRFY